MRRKCAAIGAVAMALLLSSCLVEGKVSYLEIRNATEQEVVLFEDGVRWIALAPGQEVMYPITTHDGCTDRSVLRALVDEEEVARHGPPVCEGTWEIDGPTTPAPDTP